MNIKYIIIFIILILILTLLISIIVFFKKKNKKNNINDDNKEKENLTKNNYEEINQKIKVLRDIQNIEFSEILLEEDEIKNIHNNNINELLIKNKLISVFYPSKQNKYIINLLNDDLSIVKNKYFIFNNSYLPKNLNFSTLTYISNFNNATLYYNNIKIKKLTKDFCYDNSIYDVYVETDKICNIIEFYRDLGKLNIYLENKKN